MKLTGRQFGLFIVCAFFAGTWASGQQSHIIGIVMDTASGEPVEYAQIQNFSLQKLTYSNRTGEFRLDAHAGDTLVVYGPGYFYAKVIVDADMLTSPAVRIFLRQQPMELSTANIRGIGTYEDFRYKLIIEPPPKTITDRLNESLDGPVLRAALEGFQEYQQKHPAIASIPIRTPEEIERNKLDRIKQKEQVKDQVYNKFNPAIVKEITGLTDDTEIIEFMLYCDFSDNYILEANTYDLAERIAAKFELFKKSKEEEKVRNDPFNFLDTKFRLNV